MVSVFIDGGVFSSLSNGGDEWSFVMMSCVDSVPQDCDRGESCEYGGGVIHASGSDRNGGWHAEQHDGEGDPDDCDDIL
jgi:hypothetical protein